MNKRHDNIDNSINMEQSLSGKVWILNIVNDVDDYKRRGISPTSTIYLSYSYDGILGEFIDFLHEQINEFYECNSEESDPEMLLYLEINNDEYTIKNEYRKDLKVFEFIHSVIAKGEFVPFKWTYNIHHQEIK